MSLDATQLRSAIASTIQRIDEAKQGTAVNIDRVTPWGEAHEDLQAGIQELTDVAQAMPLMRLNGPARNARLHLEKAVQLLDTADEATYASHAVSSDVSSALNAARPELATADQHLIDVEHYLANATPGERARLDALEARAQARLHPVEDADVASEGAVGRSGDTVLADPSSSGVRSTDPHPVLGFGEWHPALLSGSIGEAMSRPERIYEAGVAMNSSGKQTTLDASRWEVVGLPTDEAISEQLAVSQADRVARTAAARAIDSKRPQVIGRSDDGRWNIGEIMNAPDDLAKLVASDSYKMTNGFAGIVMPPESKRVSAMKLFRGERALFEALSPSSFIHRPNMSPLEIL